MKERRADGVLVLRGARIMLWMTNQGAGIQGTNEWDTNPGCCTVVQDEVMGTRWCLSEDGAMALCKDNQRCIGQ